MGRRRDDPVAAAGTRLMAQLLEDTDLVDHIASTEIQRRLDAGELIEAASLQLAGGLQMVPTARLVALERFARRVADAGELDVEDLSDLVWEATELVGAATIDIDTLPAPVVEEAPSDELEARRRPPGMPTEEDDRACSSCGEQVPLPVAQLTWSRWKPKMYCEACLDRFDQEREAEKEAATG